MVTYINHIVWRFVKHKPDQYKLLDVQHNVMKNLILGDCDHLIKFILFGDEESKENKNYNKESKDENGNKENNENENVIRHIPRNETWSEKNFMKGDDLDYFENKMEDNELPTNNMELAIHHCKGKFQNFKLLIIYCIIN